MIELVTAFFAGFGAGITVASMTVQIREIVGSENWGDFLRMAKNMREAQKNYFKRHTGMNECKKLERDFDDAIAHIEKCRFSSLRRQKSFLQKDVQKDE